jgi:CheY-like chemotaxis protein
LWLESHAKEEDLLHHFISYPCDFFPRGGYLLEEQIHRAHRIEILGQLAVGVERDFTNKLTVIMGYAERIEGMSTDPQVQAAARRMHEAATMSATMMQQLMAVDRLRPRDFKPVDLRAIVGETLSPLKRILSKKTELTTTFAEGPTIVQGDASMLTSALFTLAINAHDAMPDGGALRFIVDHVQLGPEQVKDLGGALSPGQYLRLQVQDTGHGISNEVRPRIFEPFFTTKGEGKGTGLGLAAVHGAVRRHHGAIGFDSEVGQGTTFTIHLPLAGDVAGAVTPAGPPPDLSAVRILVVDDEEPVATMLRETLEDEGCVVTVCRDGLSAVEYYKENLSKVDLVLLDLNLAKMDGLETISALRKIDANVKALVATGRIEKAELRAALDRGALGVVAKPFRHEQLMREIGRALGRGR